MRADIRIVIAAAVLAGSTAQAQSSSDGRVLGARRVLPSAGFKIWVPDGDLRMVAWDRDSVVVRGRIARGDSFFIGGDSLGMKLGVEHPFSEGSGGKSAIVVYVPRKARVSVKTVTAKIDATNVSGWFYSVSGSMHLSGAATSIEAETMTGNLDLDLTTSWLRARTGDGHLLLRGAPEDVDVSTVGGTLDIATMAIRRGQFGTVSGDIHYVGSPLSGAIMDFSSHSGNVELMLPRTVSGVFSLTAISGAIENGMSSVRPAAAQPRSMRVSMGRGGSQITVRTFKGSIRLRPQ
jgi:hypothetical protein